MSRDRRLSALLLALIPATLLAADTPAPASVTVAGSLQSELGCSGDWQPECESTRLTFDTDDAVWHRTFSVPAGAYEYKAALNGTWDENYGAGAARNGANIALNLAAPQDVKFYYDHETHWITSNANTRIVTAPGSFQSELGCAGDWDPSCLRSWLEDPDGDGTFTRTVVLPAGDYEVKAAIGESWAENYGAGGQQNGPNIAFSVAEGCGGVTFSFNSATNTLTVLGAAAGPQPSSVTVPGSLQSELGCSGDWQPDCAATHLTFDADDGVWQGAFDVPAGNWEYKAALNDSWTENYGLNATPNGPNLPLNLAAPASVKFYYDHETHWITSNRNAVIATVPGNFQSELGCPGDWQPDCLRSWLKDPDGDGIYAFSTRSIPAGDYEAKVAVDESWSLNYGQGGAPNGANIAFTVPAACTEVFFVWDSTTHVLTIGAAGGPQGNLNRARAHFVTRDLIAWSPAGLAADVTAELHFAAEGGLQLTGDGVTGADEVLTLTRDLAGLPAAVTAKFPHLASLAAWRIAAGDVSRVPDLLKGQLAVSAATAGGTPLDATSLQIPGVLDDLFAAPNAALGVSFSNGAPTLRLWAPTARSVRLELFGDALPATQPLLLPMTRDAKGVWSVSGPKSWDGKYYRYVVEVWAPSTKAIETNRVTDPYSVGLSKNSQRSLIVNLSDASTKPGGWDRLVKPPLDAPEDIVLYELHVRDFSASDLTVAPEHRGTYRAFAQPDASGVRHLAALARAGLTHVHLLPTFDIATIDEDKATWQSPAGDLASFPPDSEEQQARVSAVRSTDGFNWGYDPWHFGVPEGSYATNADGKTRIKEYRQMVQGLAAAGLRVVNDVVFNHTNASGQNAKSVLDRIVPGYYHRLNADGLVERSSCCENTATEHDMMEKLMVDTVVLWARQYKVDGFRFDLMGHHMKRNMLKVRQALDALTLASDGVDGRKVYVYGEAWNFGEVADGARGENAIQRNMAGTGIGSFNDRIRDGVRGGGPFSGLQEQGFATGLYYDPNATDQGSAADQLATLLHRSDWIKVGLAGNLKDWAFTDASGAAIYGDELPYHDQLTGYCADPQEVINYASAHDNETLFDAVQLKAAPAATIADRVRMSNLAVSLIGLGQGVPFFHAGDDLLRSKSLDRNSYDSGDWFNRLDFTYQTNNWGVGLPLAGDNQSNWPIFAPLLADTDLRAEPADILDAAAHFQEILSIRKSTRLLRLRTADEITSRVRSYNDGPSQLPGLIVMQAVDATGAIDPRHERVITIFNANDAPATFGHDDWIGLPLTLHPVQQGSADPIVRTSSFDPATGDFTIPGRTTAVFWTVR